MNSVYKSNKFEKAEVIHHYVQEDEEHVRSNSTQMINHESREESKILANYS